MSKRVIILGGGESGIGAALLGAKLGHDVFVSDHGSIGEQFKKELRENGIAFEENGHSNDIVLKAELVIKSPGIPPTAPIFKILDEKAIPVVSELDFALQNSNAYIIGITGSNGKTTTAHLVHHLLTKGGLDSALVGNVGHSVARELAERDHDYLVIEVSSFQLDDSPEFHPNIAILLNITKDHLDRYPSFDAYADSKMSIIKNQTEKDHFIYNSDDPLIEAKLNEILTQAEILPFSQKNQPKPGAFVAGEELAIHLKKKYSPCQFMN